MVGPSGWAGYPVMQLVALAETGTRRLLGAVFGPASRGEVSYAADLVPLLDRRLLVLADRGYALAALMELIRATQARFLIRMRSLRSLRHLPVLSRLPDGSILSPVGLLPVQTIEAELTAVLAEGTSSTERYRLATTLLDACADPAK